MPARNPPSPPQLAMFVHRIGPGPSPGPGPPSPTPTPSGRVWEEYDNYYVDSNSLNLSDRDLGGAASSMKACEARCVETDGCTAIRWHKISSHCHLLSGSTPSLAKFKAALEADSNDAAGLLKQKELDEVEVA